MVAGASRGCSSGSRSPRALASAGGCAGSSRCAGVLVLAWGVAFAFAISLKGYYDNLRAGSPDTYRALADDLRAAADRGGEGRGQAADARGQRASRSRVAGPGERYLSSVDVQRSAEPGTSRWRSLSGSGNAELIATVAGVAPGWKLRVVDATGRARTFAADGGTQRMTIALRGGLDTLRLEPVPPAAGAPPTLDPRRRTCGWCSGEGGLPRSRRRAQRPGAGRRRGRPSRPYRAEDVRLAAGRGRGRAAAARGGLRARRRDQPARGGQGHGHGRGARAPSTSACARCSPTRASSSTAGTRACITPTASSPGSRARATAASPRPACCCRPRTSSSSTSRRAGWSATRTPTSRPDAAPGTRTVLVAHPGSAHRRTRRARPPTATAGDLAEAAGAILGLR